MSKATLDIQLTELKTSATEQFNQYNFSKDLLYRTLIDSYLWWRQANLQNDYLDNLYKTAGITAKKTGNQVNFSPLIKLVWGMNGKHDGTVSHWNSAMRVIDDEFVNNRVVYQSDPSTLLVNFIRDEGGLTELRNNAGDYDEEENTSKRGKLKPKNAKIRESEIEKSVV